MQECPRQDVSDGVSWWCSTGKGRKTIRDGSVFAKSQLTLQKCMAANHITQYSSTVYIGIALVYSH